MAKKSSGAGAFADWVTVKVPKGVDTTRPLPKSDRVAQEPRVVVEKYLGADAPKPGKKLRGNPHGLGHAQLELRKKKGSSLDGPVGTKTFVLTKNKIVGTQG